MMALLKIAAFIIGRLPVALSVFLGRRLGSVVYAIDRKRKLITMENLRRAYGSELSDAQIERITKGVFIHLATVFFEFMRIPWMKESDLDGYVDFVGLENIDRALRRGKGVMLFTAHIGNWELMAAALGLKGYPVQIVARTLDNPLMEEFVKWARTRSSNSILAKNRAMRRLIKRLSENAIVGILLDQNVAREEGVFVDFFNIPACTNRGPAMLAVATGAAVIPIFTVREGTRHKVFIMDEVEMRDTGEREADAAFNTAGCTRIIEEEIRRHPEQWFWVHRRWKTRP